MKPNIVYTVNPYNKDLLYKQGMRWQASDGSNRDSKGGWFNMSKEDNPFSKMNINETLSGLSSVASPFLTSTLSGGYNSTIGNGISTIGNAVSNILPEGPLKWAVGLGSGVLGGIGNRLFGQKVDEKALSRVNSDTAMLNNYKAAATSFDDVKGIQGVANVGKVYKGGIFNKGVEKNNTILQDNLNNAKQYAYRTQDLNIDNLKGDQLNGLLAHSAAYGGALETAALPQYTEPGIGVAEYDFMKDYLTTKRMQAESKNKLSGVQSVAANNMFALGGDYQTNGADWTNGLVSIGAGGSHESNPYEGVQMGVDPEGTPNLVEEGERIFNDYVYSKRIFADGGTLEKFHLSKKRKISFADLAGLLEKESKERPNDPISKAALKVQMEQLAEQQERQKQEMEAARAREAFEALSPEEQTAIMQQVAQQEQMAQEQAIQEQAAMQQQAAELPEMAAADGQPVAEEMQAGVPTGAPMMAEGGKLYSPGGDLRRKVFDLLGLKSMQDWHRWAKDNKIESGDADIDKVVGDYIAKYSGVGTTQDDDIVDGVNWRRVLANPNFRNALSKNDPALSHALGMGYDWGLYTPTSTGGVTFPSIAQGNWENQTYEGWKDSKDPGWLEAVENWKKELGDNWADTVKKYNREQIADALRNTQAFQRGTKWLQDSEDNRLRYLTELYNNPETPEKARKYAEKYIQKDSKGNIVWKDGAQRDYETIFNNPSGRAANPGTYWHTPLEAVRDKTIRNYILNDNGEWEDLIGSIDGLEAAGSYDWSDAKGDYINNYYKRKGTDTGTGSTGTGSTDGKAKGDDWDVEPIHRNDKLRYAGLFGPAVGLGMQLAGIGRPDTSGLDAAVNMSRGAGHLADYQPIGDYMRYQPLDRLFYANQLQANARATDRNLMNTSGGNRGAAMAGLLANNYNTNNNLGNLWRQAEEYNLAQRERVAAFNKDTNKFNADAYNTTSRFNADALNRQGQYSAQLAMQAAREKMDADAAWNQGIYGNVAGLFKGIGDLGRENAQHNMIADMAATGIFGTIKNQPIGNGYIRVVPRNEAAKGGKINKKKGKRGLTF